MIEAMPHAHGYTDSRGIMSARRAIVTRYEEITGFPKLDPDNVYLGNGVSELITMTMQALLDNGDEVLIPSPDYPLWTAMTSLAGGTPVHYLCDESNGWQPDIADIESKITHRTKALLVINPNNPTGAVYSAEVLQQMVDLARKHQLLLLADEIYDKILYDDAKHISLASLAPDLLCLTFNGLSKAYRVAGYRSGWLAITGPKEHAAGFLEGIDLLASSRLCPNVPAQHAIQAALGGHQSIDDLILPGRQTARTARCGVGGAQHAIPGVSCVKPKGALYAFPRLDPNVYEIHDDAKFVSDLLVRRRRSCSCRAPASTGRTTTTCASSRCPGRGCSPRPWNGSGTSSPLPASSGRGSQKAQRGRPPAAVPALQPHRHRAGTRGSRRDDDALHDAVGGGGGVGGQDAVGRACRG